MQITGKDFGPVYVKAKSGVIVAADRPVSYMRGWELSGAPSLWLSAGIGSSRCLKTSACSLSSGNDRAHRQPDG
jgi:hypothetical protein